MGVIDQIDEYSRRDRNIVSLQQLGALNGIADEAPVNNGGFAGLEILRKQFPCTYLFPFANGFFGGLWARGKKILPVGFGLLGYAKAGDIGSKI
ncbi:MAG TPA: hypothetical protein VFX27_01975, partial [Sphingobium sp.]|nr:hypothetical protein [Sphingobium sp.]